jgi:hypothetical protein
MSYINFVSHLSPKLIVTRKEFTILYSKQKKNLIKKKPINTTFKNDSLLAILSEIIFTFYSQFTQFQSFP